MKKIITVATLAMACAGAIGANFIRIPTPDILGANPADHPATGGLPGMPGAPGQPGGPVLPVDPVPTDPPVPEVPKVAVLALDRASVDFGIVTMEKTTQVVARELLNLSNTGDAAATLAVSTTGGPFSLYEAANACGAELAPGANCNVGVAFQPVVAGMGQAGVLHISSNGGNASVPLTGGANPPLAPIVSFIEGANLVFTPEIPTGVSSSLKRVSVRNQGTGPTSLALTPSGPFVVGTAGEGSTCGATLAAGAQCTVMVKFVPTVGGLAQKGQLQFVTEDGVKVAQFTGDARFATFPIASITGAASVPTGPTFGGRSYVDTIQLFNSGTADMAVSAAPYIAGQPSGFSITGNSCTAGKVLKPSTACAVQVTFTVLEDAETHAPTTVVIPNTGSDKYNVPGVQSRTYTYAGASYLAAGNLTSAAPGQNSSAPWTLGPYGQGVTPLYDTGNGLKYTYEYVDLTNQGNAPLTITAVQLTGAPVTVSGDCEGKTLQRFDSCRMKVAYHTLPVGVNDFSIRFVNTGASQREVFSRVTIVP